MNHDNENKASNRTLAVGWFDNSPFRAICQKYVPRIKEVFFAWPGVTASRPMAEWTPERKQLFFEDIAWCRNEGMELDAIFNANCYGDIAISKALAEHVTEVLGEMDEKGLFPDSSKAELVCNFLDRKKEMGAADDRHPTAPGRRKSRSWK